MILLPQTSEQYGLLARFAKEQAGMHPSMDARYIGWSSEAKLCMVVGYNGFVGAVCQMHVAMLSGWHHTPKKMLWACFDYPFNQLKLKRVLGVVNSKNEAAMRYDLHLGFTELYRMEGMHDDGGDLVVLGMNKGDCKWLTEPPGLVLPSQSSTVGNALTH